MNNGPARTDQNWPCTGSRAVRRIPDPISAMPNDSMSSAEPRVTSACEIRLREVQLASDRRQGDVDDREIDDRHEV
jgi:hypothetical protein